MPNENLWPEDFGVDAVVTPGTILREQASALGTRTSNLVEGEVSSTTQGDSLVEQFYVYAPILDYRVPLFRVQHKIDPFPLDIYWRQWDGPRRVPDDQGFRHALGEIFQHETTRRTVAQLIANSRQRTLPFRLIEDGEWLADARTFEEAIGKAKKLIRRDGLIEIHDEAELKGIVRDDDGATTVHEVKKAQ